MKISLATVVLPRCTRASPGASPKSELSMGLIATVLWVCAKLQCNNKRTRHSILTLKNQNQSVCFWNSWRPDATTCDRRPYKFDCVENLTSGRKQFWRPANQTAPHKEETTLVIHILHCKKKGVENEHTLMCGPSTASTKYTNPHF